VIPYELTFEQRRGYLRVQVEADSIDLETAKAYNREVAAKCDELGLAKLLVVRKIPVMMSTVDVFDATTDFVNLMSGRRVAYLNPHAAIGRDFNFAITVASNRGAAIEVFGDETEAEKWLLG
jgi:hypothetical protein